MARNEEKQVTRLNRLLLQQQREEHLKKNPPRPKLNTLNSADEIKKWLPSLKKDMDFYLKQSQVACYPERKISEFSQEIEKLKREYQAFVRKLREFDPSLNAVPWTERGYLIRKRPCTDSDGDGASDNPAAKLRELDTPSQSEEPGNPVSSCGERPVQEENRVPDSDFKPLSTPLLEQEAGFRALYGYSNNKPEVSWNVCTEFEDKPLNFCVKPEMHKSDNHMNDLNVVKSHNQSNWTNVIRCDNEACQTGTQEKEQLHPVVHGAQCTVTPAKNNSNLNDSHQNEKEINSFDSYRISETSASRGSLQSLIDTYGGESEDDDNGDIDNIDDVSRPPCLSLSQ